MNQDDVVEEIAAVVRGYLMVSGETTLQEFYRQYRKDEGKSIPFSDFGYANLEDFLQAEVGCSIRELNGDILISCQSAKSEHIKNLIDSQKVSTRGRPRCGASLSRRNFSQANNVQPYPQPDLSRSNYGPPGFPNGFPPNSGPTAKRNLPPYGTPLQRAAPSSYRMFGSETDLRKFCDQRYSPQFQKFLSLKMTRFALTGVRPDIFIRSFNEAALIESRPMLDLGDLCPLDFFKGLPSVFDVVITTEGPMLYVPASSRDPELEALSVKSASSLSSAAKPKMPPASEVVFMLCAVNERFAGREFTLDDYLFQVQKEHGDGPIRYLKQRHSTNAEIMGFIAQNSNMQQPVEITQSGILRINGCKKENKDDRVKETQEQVQEFSHLPLFPFTTAFRQGNIARQKQVDAVTSSFSAGKQISFYFSTVEEERQKKKLIERINEDTSLRLAKRIGHVYKGMPCLVREDFSMSGAYERAVIIEISPNGKKVRLHLVDNGSTCETFKDNLLEISPDVLAYPTYCHPAVAGLIRPLKGAQTFQIHIAQKLVPHDGDFVQITILDYNDPYYVVDLGPLVDPLIDKGFIERDITSNGSSSRPAVEDQQKEKASYTVRCEMLPCMHCVYIVVRVAAGKSQMFVPTICLSSMFDLKTDSLLEILETDTFLTISAEHRIEESKSGELFQQLDILDCPLLESVRLITLISTKSVVPLLKACQHADSLTSVSVPLSKSDYKTLLKLFRQFDQLHNKRQNNMRLRDKSKSHERL